ncbi:O-antigen ligase family protein [bacterium]|nr:O-antigen ligase family protein [bacterium]MBU1072696.1 O-antigen ligase family protein [bacterium]MBU1675376.1 O-antigen ligase family protein [bacterium]
MTRGSGTDRLADWSTLACLATLPWIGLCVARATTGRDLGAGFQPAYLLLAVAVVASWSSGAYGKGRAAKAVPAPWIWSLALLAILLSAVGVWRSPGLATPQEAWARYGRQLTQWLLMSAFALHLAVWLRGETRWRQALIALMAGLSFQFLYGAWQVVDFYGPGTVFAGLDSLFTSNPAVLSGSGELYLGRDFVGIPRVRGTACEPLYLGNYVLALLPWTILLASGRRRLFWLPAAGVILLFSTWSRGAWLAVVPGIVVGLICLRRSGGLRIAPKPWRALAGAGILVLVAYVLTDGQVFALMAQRVRQSVNMEDWSNLTRLYSMQAAWRAFLLQPIFGIGWGQYGYHFALLVDPMGLQSQFAWPVVNNYPLAVLCETGLFGFAAFVCGMIALAGRVWRSLAPRQVAEGRSLPIAQRRLVAATVGVTAVWFQLLTFSQYNLPHIWVSLGLLLAALSGGDKPSEAGEGRS